MQNSQDLQRDLAAASLDAIGGEPLAGSSFETEEPESGFAGVEPRSPQLLWRPNSPATSTWLIPSSRPSA
jgi:hypothetical protein